MKGKYIGWLMLEYINGAVWKVIQNYNDKDPFGFTLSDGRVITIPHDFPTDFATIPRIFWVIAPPVGRGARSAYGKAAVIHDYLYASREIEGNAISRKEADNIFLNCMKVSDVSTWRYFIIWSAVRLFGWLFWKGYLHEINSKAKQTSIDRT